MADIVFNIAKGRVVELFNNRVDASDPTNAAIVLVLLKVVEADATLKDYDTLSALLGGSNTECDFTNYAREVLTDADITAGTVDDTGDDFEVAIPDWVIASAGGATNNSIVKLLVCYDSDSTAGTDANIVPLTAHDLTVTTDGTQLTIAPSSTSFFRAS